MLRTKNLCSGVKNKSLGLEERELVENKSPIFKQLMYTKSLLFSIIWSLESNKSSRNNIGCTWDLKLKYFIRVAKQYKLY